MIKLIFKRVFLRFIKRRRFDKFIEYYYNVLMILPQGLLDKLDFYSSNNFYSVHPILGDDENSLLFSHVDYLRWKKKFIGENFYVKSLDEIRLEVNLFCIYVIDRNKNLLVNEDIKSVYLGIKNSKDGFFI